MILQLTRRLEIGALSTCHRRRTNRRDEKAFIAKVKSLHNIWQYSSGCATNRMTIQSKFPRTVLDHYDVGLEKLSIYFKIKPFVRFLQFSVVKLLSSLLSYSRYCWDIARPSQLTSFGNCLGLSSCKLSGLLM